MSDSDSDSETKSSNFDNFIELLDQSEDWRWGGCCELCRPEQDYYNEYDNFFGFTLAPNYIRRNKVELRFAWESRELEFQTGIVTWTQVFEISADTMERVTAKCDEEYKRIQRYFGMFDAVLSGFLPIKGVASLVRDYAFEGAAQHPHFFFPHVEEETSGL